MPNGRYHQYRGYRIEVSQTFLGGWRLAVYRLSLDLPAPRRASAVEFETEASAIRAGRTNVDWLLSHTNMGGA